LAATLEILAGWLRNLSGRNVEESWRNFVCMFFGALMRWVSLNLFARFVEKAAASL
jgi:hypothetical protein